MDNKSKIIEVINSYYGDNEISEDELKSIEKIAQDDKNTQDLIDILTKSKGRKASDSRSIKEGFLLNTIKMLELRSNSTTNQNTKENIDKIMEATNEYFGDDKVDFTEKQKDLISSVAKFDGATNNLVKWLDDAVQNDEERNIKNYFTEVMDAYEDQLSINESKEFVKQLKKLNPDVDIKLSDDYNSIDISKPINELNMPETFYVDENNFITNKENTALSVYVSLKVNEKNNNMNKEENNMSDGEREEEIINDNDFLEENSKKEKKSKRKPKFRLFRAIKNKFIKINDSAKEEIDLDSDSDTEELNLDIPNKDSKEQDTAKKTENKKNENTKEQENKTSDNTKKAEEVVNKSETPKENVEQVETKSDEPSESHTETVNTTLSAGENLKRIAKIRSEIERLQRNKEELKNIQNASKYAKEETAKHYDEETKKLRDQIKEIVDNNKYTNEAGREISMEERDRFDRLDAVQADIIETVKKQKQINSEFNEAWYGHMGEKVTEDLLKRRSTLKNELDAINIKLNLLKQKREEIVAENPMTHARTM